MQKAELTHRMGKHQGKMQSTAHPSPAATIEQTTSDIFTHHEERIQSMVANLCNNPP